MVLFLLPIKGGTTMNLIFDLDDTLYDLMGPFELVHKKLYADKTDADCTELFIKSRDYSDEIMEAEIKGDHMRIVFMRELKERIMMWELR
jgi:FMN phosphatase YigB (HAD superfamily)